MFTMMNTARLAVGIQGLALAERAYQNALAYARERLQMPRAVAARNSRTSRPTRSSCTPDVRRMLLTQKALIEGGRALALYAAMQVDMSSTRGDAADAQARRRTAVVPDPDRQGAAHRDGASECTNHALQIFGGHGYIAEYGMEQFVRDARITTIYEGTTRHPGAGPARPQDRCSCRARG